MPEREGARTRPASVRRSVYIMLNPDKPDAEETVRAILPFLRRRAEVLGVDRDRAGSLKSLTCDLLIVVGGDGTILSAARRLEGAPIPTIGINVGHTGFLAEASPSEARKVLAAALDGRARISRRMMLECEVRRGGRARVYHALNDVVVTRGSHSKLITLDLRINGESVSNYSGDGLVISTATGSTAYCLSAGGPILSERVDAFILCPICAHTLANRAIVVAGDEHVRIAPVSRGGRMECAIDGQIFIPLRDGDALDVSKSGREFLLVTLGRRGRYEVIRDKLHWAGWVKERRR
ncbi:MAG: NAD(+)/NADH kinase [Planctomycetota bacterium]|nr:NAD(+)/NADH kinase [Planctomycetota bacterium]